MESSSTHSKANQEEEPFRIRQHQSRPNHQSYISDVKCDFYSKEKAEWGDVLCVKFDEYDKYIGASYSSGGFKVLNPFTGKVITTILNPQLPLDDSEAIQIPSVINSFKFRATKGTEKDILLTVNTEGKLQYWNFTEYGKLLHTVEPQQDESKKTVTGFHSAHNDPYSSQHSQGTDQSLNTLDINCTKDRVAVGGNQCKIHIYDDQSLKKDYILSLKPGGSNLPGHSKRIYCVKFDKTQDSIVYSGGWDDAIYVSDLRTGGNAVSIIPGPHICGDAIDVVGNLLVAASYRNQRNLQLFDIRNPSKVLQYLEMDPKSNNHFSETQLYAAQFSKTMWTGDTQTKILAAAGTGQRNEIKFFESSGGVDEGIYQATHHINQFQGGIYSMDFSMRSNKLVVGTAGGLVASFRLRVTETMS